MTATHPMILLRDGIKESLRINANLNMWIGERIHHKSAPIGENVPFVEFVFVDGGWIPRDPRQHVEVVFEVSAISTDEKQALELSQEIHRTLVGRPVPMGGWDNYATLPGDWAIEQFVSNSQEYYKVGEIYEFRCVRRG